jgi:hypothetical protein
MNKLQLKINEPCHENWEAMNAADHGRFCQSCEKQVIDFSTMSDQQVIAFFKRPPSGSVCGRFHEQQLDRPLQERRRRIPWLKYFFQFFLPAMFFTRAGAQVKMGKVSRPVKDSSKILISEQPRLMGMVAPSIHPFEKEPKSCMDTTEITVKGKIVTESGEPIPFAGIRAGSTLTVVFADEKGDFSITVAGSEKSIIVSSSGYNDRQLDPSRITANMTIRMEKAENISDLAVSASQSFIVGEISIVNRDQVRTDSINAMDQVIQRDINIPIEKANFSVYPNPVLHGASISVGVQLLEEGYYRCQFISVAGQLVQEKQIWIDKEARLLNIDVPKTPAGNYLFVLVNKTSGKKYTQKISIQ